MADNRCKLSSSCIDKQWCRDNAKCARQSRSRQTTPEMPPLPLALCHLYEGEKQWIYDYALPLLERATAAEQERDELGNIFSRMRDHLMAANERAEAAERQRDHYQMAAEAEAKFADQYRAENEALRADKARLDWVEKQGTYGIHVESSVTGGEYRMSKSATVFLNNPLGEWRSTTVRAAIDRAMKDETG